MAKLKVEQPERDPEPDLSNWDGAYTDTAFNLRVMTGVKAPLPEPAAARQLRIADYPRNEITAHCKYCGQIRRFRTHRMIAEFGRKETVGDVLAMKAEPCTCLPRANCHLLIMADCD